MTRPRQERTACHGRLPFVDPASMTPRQRAVYDQIVGGPRATAERSHALTDEHGHLLGPFNAMVLSAELGGPLQELGAAIRYRSSLPARLRELAILEVARHRDCAVEWNAHAHVATRLGVTDGELQAVLDGVLPPDPQTHDGLVRRIAQQLLTTRDIDDDLMATAETALGLAQVNEIVILVGYYDLLALSLRVWRTPTPPGAGSAPFRRDP